MTRFCFYSKKILKDFSRFNHFFASLFLLGFFCCQNIFAKELSVEIQGNFHDWNFVKTDRGDKEICYLVSIPISRNDSLYRRGESFFLVTNIPNDADEVSVSSGFYLDEKSDTEISFGSKKFYLFPYKTLSWAGDKNDDIDIIKEMQKHDEFTIIASSQDGRITNDIYSLIGFNFAYKQMKQNCK